MKLKYPDTDIDFDGSPRNFLECFDVYDREETLGEVLNRFDPNDPVQLSELIRQYVFDPPRVAHLTAGHRALLILELKKALDENYDFGPMFTSDQNSPAVIELPSKWVIRDPRGFFEEIYRQAKVHWSENVTR